MCEDALLHLCFLSVLEKNSCSSPFVTLSNSTSIVWGWLPLRLSKRLSPATVLFRTTLTQMITLYKLLILLGWKHQLSIKVALSCYLATLWKARRSLHQLNSITSNLVLLLKTTWRYWNCFLSPVAMDGMDRNGLKLEKNGQFFRVLMLLVSKILKKFIMVSPLW